MMLGLSLGLGMQGGAVAAPAAPVGQQLFTANGNTSFVVPAGVTTICAVAIGHGGASLVNDPGAGGDASGGGGALSFTNNIAVTPGETLTVSISQSGTSGGGGSRLLRSATVLLQAQPAVYNLAGNAAAGVGGTRFDGGSGNTPGSTPTNTTGGGAGGYTSAGGNAATGGTSNGGGGTSPLGGSTGGSAGGSGAVEGALYGGGAGVSTGGTTGVGALGCVRIVWGAGRAFPNTNTGDLS